MHAGSIIAHKYCGARAVPPPDALVLIAEL